MLSPLPPPPTSSAHQRPSFCLMLEELPRLALTPPLMQGPHPFQSPLSSPQRVALDTTLSSASNTSHSDHFRPSPQLLGRKRAAQANPSQNLKGGVGGGMGSNAIFKEILMVGISGIITKPEWGHSGAGPLGRSPHRTCLLSGRSHSAPAPALLSAALGSGFQVSTLLPACRALY